MSRKLSCRFFLCLQIPKNSVIESVLVSTLSLRCQKKSCGKQECDFRSRASFLEHYKAHSDESHECQLCQKVFDTNIRLKVNMVAILIYFLTYLN